MIYWEDPTVIQVNFNPPSQLFKQQIPAGCFTWIINLAKSNFKGVFSYHRTEWNSIIMRVLNNTIVDWSGGAWWVRTHHSFICASPHKSWAGELCASSGESLSRFIILHKAANWLLLIWMFLNLLEEAFWSLKCERGTFLHFPVRKRR